jgi:hypothetical protein
MDTATIRSLIADLAGKRPLFHNEADFQHAFAWHLQLAHRDARIRLEWRSSAAPRASIDLYANVEGWRVALEFKYLTRRFVAEVDDEAFSLRSQGAQDLGRYDTIKDVVRLEHLAAAGAVDAAWVILLTNDEAYWSPRRSAGTIDEAFGLHDGARLTGTLTWAAHAGGTTRGRESAHELKASYECVWLPYSKLADGPGGTFRYLCLPVHASAPQEPSMLRDTTASSTTAPSAAKVQSGVTAREHVLAALDRLEQRHGRDSFEVAEIVHEALAGGATQAESTLRTHVVSVMCVNAPANHVARWPDLERMGGGRYRRIRSG